MLQEQVYDSLAGDVWSLGVCLYVATNNVLPFNLTQDINE